MSGQTLFRYGAVAGVASAAFLILGGIMLVLPATSQGAIVPIFYYLALILLIFGYMALYGVQVSQAGRLGAVGFALGVLGAVMYSAPNYVLIAGISGAQAWHEIWAFAMGQGLLLLVGPPLFFLGTMMLGVATTRAGKLPRRSGILMAVGSALWLVAYVLSVVPVLLTIASLLLGAGLAWAAYAILRPSPAPVALAPG